MIRRGTFIADVTYEHAAEVLDTLTGRTTVSLKPKEIVVVGSKIDRQDEGALSPAAVGGQDAIWLDLGGPLGIAPRQTLRITVLLPRLSVPRLPRAEDGRKYKMLVAPLILDADGRVIVSRPEITLEPGQFHSFDFERAELPPGEPGTNACKCALRSSGDSSPESPPASHRARPRARSN